MLTYVLVTEKDKTTLNALLRLSSAQRKLSTTIDLAPRWPSLNHSSIPVVVIGYARSNSIKTMPRTFEDTSYVMTGFLDVLDSPQHLQCTKHNLEVVINSLHLRPRALIIGPAIHPDVVAEMREAWEGYVQRCLEGEHGAFVSLPDFKYINPKIVTGPPSDAGWDAEMFRQLEAVFGKGAD